ncbi:MAG: tetratricopeptide repeat protein [Acidobacteriia bacterium]|nr:tetratricopeptide repeat protein [Terriglobia bacterium]
MWHGKLKILATGIVSWRVLRLLLTILFVTAVYLFVFPSPTLPYIAAVLVHAAIGVLAVLFLVPRLATMLSFKKLVENSGWLAISASGVIGIYLLYIGTSRSHWNWMYAHVAVSLAGIALLVAKWVGSKGWLARNVVFSAARVALFLGLAAALGLYGWKVRQGRWLSSHRIVNPPPPTSMDGEGDGPKGPFFPSSSQTVHKGGIPSKYFMESDACERCHSDIYKQWSGSMHHFSSFNNQWYRKSIEYMQNVVGVKPSKWCAGCHDPALLYSGLFDTPIKQIVDRPEARAGLGCMMCHSISGVKSTMGQGDFMLEYPKLHQLAASKNPVARWLHDFVTNLNPEPHRRVFLKPFMRTQSSEFCSSCHKVHLDGPVNHYRWIRGFNEYDNWQASGVSGMGARSFYYPPKPQQCTDCHMPTVKSGDSGNVQGMIHSHAFPGANTAVPIANENAAQLKLSENFLKNSVTVDIFAISPAQPKSAGGEMPSADIATGFAVGEEAETNIRSQNTQGETNGPMQISAPLNRVNPAVRRGDSVLVDVVVRTRKVGHFFPGGTVDAYDTWVELKATDKQDRVIFWSGQAEDGGKGPVDPGAHFYRALQIDAHGHPINKRNAWSTRATVYVRLIPPGAADTVHYHLRIPKDAGDKIKLHARLLYRKFSWFNTHFAFAGVSDPNAPPSQTTPDFDDRNMSFTGDTSRVSGNLKKIPDLPTITVSENEVTLNVLPANSTLVQPKVALQPDDWTRWNDYGIGLFLQGDLKGARQAFEQITRIDPKNPDGWVNLGRVALQEGDVARARTVLEEALQLNPELARANYFFARVLRAEGNYSASIDRLQKVIAQYPQDRVALNDLGRIFFLQRKYADAIAQLQRVLKIDPEDLQAHYSLMLCYQGQGESEKAQHEQKLYLRFKADESSQALTGPYRQTHPHDNNERQAIHEHDSVALPSLISSDLHRPSQPRHRTLAPSVRAESTGKPEPAKGGGQ